MIYLALDQALQTTGYAVFENDELIKWGTFSTNPTYPIEERLYTIQQQLTELDKQYNIGHVFFEDTQKQVNLDTYKRLCYVQSIIMLWCRNRGGIQYNILSPSHWRKILKDKYKINWGRKREEQKQAALDWVRQEYDGNFTTDSADAICIGRAGILEYNKNKSAF